MHGGGQLIVELSELDGELVEFGLVGEWLPEVAFGAGDLFGGELVVCDRWFASTRTCSACGSRKPEMSLAERTFKCEACGLVMNRDRNAAANLAAWAESATMAAARAPDRQAGGRVTTPLEGKALAVAAATAKPAPMKEEPTLQRLPGPRTPEKGGVRRPQPVVRRA